MKFAIIFVLACMVALSSAAQYCDSNSDCHCDHHHGTNLVACCTQNACSCVEHCHNDHGHGGKQHPCHPYRFIESSIIQKKKDQTIFYSGMTKISFITVAPKTSSMVYNFMYKGSTIFNVGMTKSIIYDRVVITTPQITIQYYVLCI